jgi:signal transduction histidine kinase
MIDLDWITIAVTGIGVTAEQMGKLFQEFFPSLLLHGEQIRGTGFGLAISKRSTR